MGAIVHSAGGVGWSPQGRPGGSWGAQTRAGGGEHRGWRQGSGACIFFKAGAHLTDGVSGAPGLELPDLAYSSSGGPFPPESQAAQSLPGQGCPLRFGDIFYFKKLMVYLKLKFNWMPSISSKSPNLGSALVL